MKFSHAFFDLDGTVYLEEKLIPGIPESLWNLKQSGTQIFYITNNTSVAVLDYYKKLNRFGLPVEDGCVISPTLTLGNWIKESPITYFYPVGTNAFNQELSALSGKNISHTEPQLVVIAFDTELNYAKLKKACELINGGIPWVSTHIDLACPSLNGPIPDCGAIAKLISSATNVDYVDHFGKPSKFMVQMIREISGYSTSILVAGDRLYTDIKLGIELECTTVLVCSGEYQLGSFIPYRGDLVQVHETLPIFLNSMRIP